MHVTPEAIGELPEEEVCFANVGRSKPTLLEHAPWPGA